MLTDLPQVFVNKKRHDDKIASHLNRIQKLLPRLEAWKGIYRHEKMEQLVSDTYHLVIELSRAAAEYFCRRWMRVWLAVNPLAMSSKFDDLAQSIYETLAEVNAEANQGLHARSEMIERTVLNLERDTLYLKRNNADLQTQVAALQSKLDERDKQADDEKFRILEEDLIVSFSLAISTTNRCELQVLTFGFGILGFKHEFSSIFRSLRCQRQSQEGFSQREGMFQCEPLVNAHTHDTYSNPHACLIPGLGRMPGFSFTLRPRRNQQRGPCQHSHHAVLAFASSHTHS